QHKAVIFFATFTFIFGLISIIIGLCSPCFTPNALLCSVALFLTTSCSALADLIFFFAAMRMDTRFVHGTADVYEQRIGYAAIIHLIATIFFLLSLIFSLLAAYLLISSRRTAECCCFITEYQIDYRQEPYAKWR
uniref:G_PROTEIN_RECEP_F1_2 domain-containing protein n=1 Tax=Ascaris lumbricoides TaxID=6252 RepID=A0A0M3HSZ6_ASCLU